LVGRTGCKGGASQKKVGSSLCQTQIKVVVRRTRNASKRGHEKSGMGGEPPDSEVKVCAGKEERPTRQRSWEKEEKRIGSSPREEAAKINQA